MVAYYSRPTCSSFERHSIASFPFASMMLTSLPPSTVLVGITIFWLANRIAQFLRRRKWKECAEPNHISQESPLGVQMLKQSYDSLQHNTYLALTEERFHEYGNTYAFKQLGSPGILTIEPENVKAILATQFHDFGIGRQRAHAFEPLIGHGIFTADGDAWKIARKLIRQCFDHEKSTDLTLFARHVDHLISRLPLTNEVVDLQMLFQELTMDISTDFLFGTSTSLLSSKEAEPCGRRFADAFDLAQRDIIKAMALGPLGFPELKSSFRESRNVVHKFVSDIIDRALASGSTDNQDDKSNMQNFLQKLTKQTQNRDYLFGSSLNMLLAGRDTTSSLLSNLFFVLSRRPEVYQALAAEVESFSSQPDVITLEDLRSMRYLRACINESLRLHPPIPRNSRVALRDTTLPRGGGLDGQEPVFVAKGTQVGYHIYSMHRRKDIYGDDAEDFVPERWFDDKFRPGYGFLPFNGGPRICIGQQFALNLAMYTCFQVVKIIVRLEAKDQEPWKEGLGITCSTRDGTHVKIWRRDRCA